MIQRRQLKLSCYALAKSENEVTGEDNLWLVSESALWWEQAHGDEEGILYTHAFGPCDSAKGRKLRVQLLTEMAYALEIWEENDEEV